MNKWTDRALFLNHFRIEIDRNRTGHWQCMRGWLIFNYANNLPYTHRTHKYDWIIGECMRRISWMAVQWLDMNVVWRNWMALLSEWMPNLKHSLVIEHLFSHTVSHWGSNRTTAPFPVITLLSLFVTFWLYYTKNARGDRTVLQLFQVQWSWTFAPLLYLW